MPHMDVTQTSTLPQTSVHEAGAGRQSQSAANVRHQNARTTHETPQVLLEAIEKSFVLVL